MYLNTAKQMLFDLLLDLTFIFHRKQSVQQIVLGGFSLHLSSYSLIIYEVWSTVVLMCIHPPSYIFRRKEEDYETVYSHYV